MKHNSLACANLSKSTLRSLAEKNIFVIGLTIMPDISGPMPMGSGTPAYILCNDDEGQLRTHAEVLALATEPVEPGDCISDDTFSWRGYTYTIFQPLGDGLWAFTCGWYCSEAEYASRVTAIMAAKRHISFRPAITV